MKVMIEYDTVAKTLSVNKNGSALTNLCSVSFYKHYDDEGFSMDICEEEMDKKEKMSTRVYTMAKSLGYKDEN